MVQTNIKYLKAEDFTGNMKNAVSYLLKNYDNLKSQEVGKYEVDSTLYYMIQEYDSKEKVVWESHKKYIDIQVVLSGEELMNVTGIHDLTPLEYNEDKDFLGHEGKVLIPMIMKEGDLAVFYPEDVHQPGLRIAEPVPVKKCVMKVLI